MTFEVLFVCTGNICRSPVAERLLPTHLSKALDIIASSAGTRAVMDAPIHETMRGLLSAREVPVDGFVPQKLTKHLIMSSTVVLTMTLEHRSAVVALAPWTVGRTFTLLEFAALCEHAVSKLLTETPEERLAEVVQWAATNRGPAMANCAPAELEIKDPYGHDPAAYQSAFDSIDLALIRITRTVDL